MALNMKSRSQGGVGGGFYGKVNVHDLFIEFTCFVIAPGKDP